MNRLTSAIIDVSLVIVMTIAAFFAGFIISIELYGDNETNVVGFYFAPVTIEKLESIGERARYKGEWICIDAKDVDSAYDILNTCSHEVAHHIYRKKFENEDFYLEDEVFAEFCEDDLDMCIEKFGDLNEN